MKKVFCLLLAMPFAAMAQKEKFTVNGQIGNLNAPAKIYLRYTDRYTDGKNQLPDSAVLVNGRFRFEGSVASPAHANLALKHTPGGIPELLFFFLEKGAIQVSSTDSLK